MPERQHTTWGGRALVLAVTIATIFDCQCPAISRAGEPDLDWSAGLLIGSDDAIMADPERLGVLDAVTADFRTAQGGLGLQWKDLGGGTNRLGLRGRAALTSYGATVPGDDTDLRLSATLGRWFRSGTFGEARLAGTRFRREGLPLFDLDRLRGGVYLTRGVGRRWSLVADAEYARLGFPGRLIAEGSRETERDQQWSLLTGVVRSFRSADFLKLEVGYRSTTSNDELVEYGGSFADLDGLLGLVGGLELIMAGAYNQRVYDEYPVITAAGVPTGASRRDHAWQGGVGLQYCLLPRCDLFAHATGTYQTSNIDAFAFDQTRVQIGFAVVSARAPALAPSSLEYAIGVAGDADDPGGESSLAPRQTPTGVVFRYRAPAARMVAVVGGFNGWDAKRSLLPGPDAQGFWEVTIPIPPGIWRYAMVVDGDWVMPPAAPRYEDDGFGGANGVLEIALPAGAGIDPATGRRQDGVEGGIHGT